MKKAKMEPEMEVLKRLKKIPNVGDKFAGYLVRLGITGFEELAVQDPGKMYDRLCRMKGKRIDPCVHDVFSAIVSHAKGDRPRPWWYFSRIRIAAQKKKPR